MKTRSVFGIVIAVTVSVAPVCTQHGEKTPQQKATLHLIATAHFDTQWNFYTNINRFEKYPGYVFSCEGAIHYMWFKEYHPHDWAKVQKYVAHGRWRLAGTWINAVVTNMPSPETPAAAQLRGKVG
jgi:alpha-mannosidase